LKRIGQTKENQNSPTDMRKTNPDSHIVPISMEEFIHLQDTVGSELRFNFVFLS